MAAAKTTATTRVPSRDIDVVNKINKKFGANTVIRGDQLALLEIPRLTTGSLAFDLALGGGFAANQWHEIIGNESSGKSSFIMKLIGYNMRLDPNFTVVWVASEPLVVPWAKAAGMDMKRVWIIDTNVMEEAYEGIIEFLDTRDIDAVVVDSLPLLVPREEEDKAFDAWQQGLGARLTGKFFRVQTARGKRSLVETDRLVTGFIVNQWREKIGITWGDPRTTPGGKGKNFSYFTRLELSRDEWIEDGGDKYGITIKGKTIKNKSFPPQRTALVDFYFEDYEDLKAGSYDTIKEIAVCAVAYRVVDTVSKGHYEFKGLKMHGMPGVHRALAGDPALAAEVTAYVRAKVLGEPLPMKVTPRRKTMKRTQT